MFVLVLKSWLDVESVNQQNQTQLKRISTMDRDDGHNGDDSTKDLEHLVATGQTDVLSMTEPLINWSLARSFVFTFLPSRNRFLNQVWPTCPMLTPVLVCKCPMVVNTFICIQECVPACEYQLQQNLMFFDRTRGERVKEDAEVL